jgi:hypothetical protein
MEDLEDFLWCMNLLCWRPGMHPYISEGWLHWSRTYWKRSMVRFVVRNLVLGRSFVIWLESLNNTDLRLNENFASL